MKASDLLSKVLRMKGVEYILGIPGEERSNASLYAAPHDENDCNSSSSCDIVCPDHGMINRLAGRIRL